MTTVRGIVRSYVAAVNRAERAQQKRNRETARQYKQLEKEQGILNAADSVAKYEAY